MTLDNVLVGPTPPYNNPPINPQFYKPKRYVISAMTLGKTTIVTTSIDNDYAIGQLVRLLIPQANGCYQLNESQGFVISIHAPDEVEINIDSSLNVNQFVATVPGPGVDEPQILAIGDTNTGAINSSGRTNNILYINGSYQNISPL